MAAILAIFNFLEKAHIHLQIIIKYSSGPNFSQIGAPNLLENVGWTDSPEELHR